MIKLSSATMLSAAAFVAMAAGASAQNWNDEVVDAAKSKASDALTQGEGEALRLLKTNLYAESERTRRSNVKLIDASKYVSAVTGLPDMKVYRAAVDIDNGSGKITTMLVDLTPEEAERMKMEAADTEGAQQVANMMDGMASGMIMLGAGLRQGIADSQFADLLSVHSKLTDIQGGPGGDLSVREGCIAYLKRIEDGRKRVRAGSEEAFEEFADGLTEESVGLIWGGIDPLTMMVTPACMFLATADHVRNMLPPTYAELQKRALQEFQDQAKIVDGEKIDGHPTKIISLNGLSRKQKMEDGSEFEIKNANMWLDTDYYKNRRLRLEGTLTQDGKTQEIFIERENNDFRRVGDSYMYEPYKETLKAGGVLTDKQRRELAKAKEQMADFEKQMAAMPPDQRAMMERMVGPQIEQLRNLVDNGAVTIEVFTRKITINPDLGDDGAFYALFSGGAGGPGGTGRLPGGDDSVATIQSIQLNLKKLGYDPGAATGELTDKTREAISKYQADKGLAVTGQPSSELAQALQADVNKQ